MWQDIIFSPRVSDFSSKLGAADNKPVIKRIIIENHSTIFSNILMNENHVTIYRNTHHQTKAHVLIKG